MTRRTFAQVTGTALAIGLTRPIKSSSSDGLVAASLEAAPSRQAIAGQTVQLLAYNGQLPGPLFELHPGDTFGIQFKNSLAEATNLHFHGLHVSPSGDSDNPLRMVAPGETATYEIQLPNNHAAGTFWYHPHMHGSTAKQVFGGLSGAIIVRGDLDAIPEIAAAAEAVLMLKDFTFDSSGRVVVASLMERVQGREGRIVTVNGDVSPTLGIQQDGLLRCRAINASSSRYYRLKVEEHPLGLIATDGGALPRVDWRDEVLIVPGQRVEFLLQGNRTPGVYRVLNLPYNRGAMGYLTSTSLLLGQLTYSGRADQAVPPPDSLASVEPLPLSRLPLRTFQLSQGMMMSFDINGRTFNPNRIDTSVQLNSTEDWELVNNSQMDHPFHIHTNPFQLVGANGIAEPAWRDVVNVPRFTRQRIRMRFSDFTGTTVYHCHILDHEDLGMMGVLEIRG